MKILNLYAGIGGNRKLWGDNHEIVAVEYDQATADEYSRVFPKDKIIVTDAHEYLLRNYMKFDFIWSSPPCPTHSDIRRCGVHAGQYEALYPEMSLYQEIILLMNFSPKETKFIVENVKPYYEPLIQPTYKLHRHFYWSNFKLTSFEVVNNRKHDKIQGNSTVYGFNIKDSKIKDKRKALRNMVDPDLGKHILDCALNKPPK
ncbi:DNA cytosine methyltransferase [Chryseobacterium sp.]|uniref:DNA cytosine methyltransferase n=1 Tax=Chryseobacterium sp. TaxID=1871047 RepID=UPI002FCAAEBA